MLFIFLYKVLSHAQEPCVKILHIELPPTFYLQSMGNLSFKHFREDSLGA